MRWKCSSLPIRLYHLSGSPHKIKLSPSDSHQLLFTFCSVQVTLIHPSYFISLFGSLLDLLFPDHTSLNPQSYTFQETNWKCLRIRLETKVKNKWIFCVLLGPKEQILPVLLFYNITSIVIVLCETIKIIFQFYNLP